mmetsp:Transcript_25114/g.40843  ORF Transcript_25114/g.40843 Transcript_25114/m.40843 type:complete len:85 (-) Transcript_25114:30-284(-)
MMLNTHYERVRSKNIAFQMPNHVREGEMRATLDGLFVLCHFFILGHVGRCCVNVTFSTVSAEEEVKESAVSAGFECMVDVSTNV